MIRLLSALSLIDAASLISLLLFGATVLVWVGIFTGRL